MSYKITNIEYGIGPWATEMLYGAEIGNPAPGQVEQNIHSFTYLEGNGHKILVDTGIDTDDPEKDALWKSFGQHINGTTKGLEMAGFAYEDIDTIIITHAHIDHIGAISRFPNAHIYMQQEEFEEWERMVGDSRYAQLTLPATYPPDYPIIRKMVDAGRITLLNGDVINLLPGISIHCVRECHSVVEQLVVVKTQGCEYIIAGDVACRLTNLVGHEKFKGYLAPILGRSGSAHKVFEAYSWILDRVNGDATKVILAHDSTLKDRFETVGEPGFCLHYIVK